MWAVSQTSLRSAWCILSFTYVGDSFCFLMKSSFLLFGVTMRDLVDFVLEIISVKRLTVSVVMNS